MPDQPPDRPSPSGGPAGTGRAPDGPPSGGTPSDRTPSVPVGARRPRWVPAVVALLSITAAVLAVLLVVDLSGGTQLLATGSDDTTVRLWDPTTGQPHGQPLTGHTDWVRAVGTVTLPGGHQLLASGSGDRTVRLWDPATGAQIGGPDSSWTLPAPVNTLAGLDGGTLAVGFGRQVAVLEVTG